MEVYFQVFVNFKKNNWAMFLPIAKFTYNNTKNASTGYTLFELNYGYHLRISFGKNTNPCLQSKTADKLSAELQELMSICQKNLHQI